MAWSTCVNNDFYGQVMSAPSDQYYNQSNQIHYSNWSSGKKLPITENEATM